MARYGAKEYLLNCVVLANSTLVVQEEHKFQSSKKIGALLPSQWLQFLESRRDCIENQSNSPACNGTRLCGNTTGSHRFSHSGLVIQVGEYLVDHQGGFIAGDDSDSTTTYPASLYVS